MPEFIVTEKAMRPASRLRQCFYCHARIGSEHKEDCVLIRRPVRLRAIIEYDVLEVASWSAEQIEFYRNEQWCADNIIAELDGLRHARKSCLCGAVKFAFVREAGEPQLVEQ
jgi:hypothetical protein